jgi:DNA-binding NtrC family response regulator
MKDDAENRKTADVQASLFRACNAIFVPSELIPITPSEEKLYKKPKNRATACIQRAPDRICRPMRILCRFVVRLKTSWHSQRYRRFRPDAGDPMLFTKPEREVVENLVRLAYANPFLPERMQLEGKLLGHDANFDLKVLHRAAEFPSGSLHSNTIALRALTFEHLGLAYGRLLKAVDATSDELQLYEDLALFSLYLLVEEEFEDLVIEAEQARRSTRRLGCWALFSSEHHRLLGALGEKQVLKHSSEHAFACFFQVTRAFKHIFDQILGSSMQAAQLRASVWESIFSYDLRRYSRWLYRSIDQIATLITGPSGTGKELVARAIGVSRYIPFDTQREVFAVDYDAAFYAVNLSALPATLIESELFGHRKGAFTGATSDRIGWLEQCPSTGAVFLDEIGELDGALQVKLLRVLQTRKFQRLGETTDRAFQGKLIAATNRDLAFEMQSGRFRHDLYYRLCADQIATPSLFEQLQASPEDLKHFVAHVAKRIFGEVSDDLDAFCSETVRWIEQHLGRTYRWPGNIRELEQCVRNLLIHQNYKPATTLPTESENLPLIAFLSDVEQGTLSRDELLGRYFALVMSHTTTLEAASDQLGVDRRTLKRLIDYQFLAKLQARTDSLNGDSDR